MKNLKGLYDKIKVSDKASNTLKPSMFKRTVAKKAPIFDQLYRKIFME